MFTAAGKKLPYVAIDQEMDEFIEIKECDPIVISSKIFLEVLVRRQLAMTNRPIDYLYKFARAAGENCLLSTIRTCVIIKHETAKSYHLMISNPLKQILSFIFEYRANCHLGHFRHSQTLILERWYS